MNLSNLEVTRWSVPGNPGLRYYSGLPLTGFALRDQSDNYDRGVAADRGLETITTVPGDLRQLGFVRSLYGSDNALPHQPVVTWPGCLEFHLYANNGHSWETFEHQLAGILMEQYRIPRARLSFVDGDGQYRPDQPMVIIGRYPYFASHVRLLTNYPLVGRYGYRCDGQVSTQGGQPDPYFPALLVALGRVTGILAQPAFIYPNHLSLVCRHGYEGTWPDLAAAVLREFAPIVGLDPMQFVFHELRMPYVEPED